jgi:hypothetical protein
MLKRLLFSILPFLGSSCRDGAKPAGDIRMMDPKGILFTLATLCDPVPAVEDSRPPSGSRSLHEDDWRQIEFVPAINEDYVRTELASLAVFKTQHQKGIGWTSIYLRKEHPHPLSELRLPYSALPTLSTSAVTLSGRLVRGGFALSDGGDWFLYGQRSSDGKVIQLALSSGQSICSERFGAGTDYSRRARAAGRLVCRRHCRHDVLRIGPGVGPAFPSALMPFVRGLMGGDPYS